MTNLPIALQLYTVRDETAHDFAGTLRQVAALGYHAVECAGYGNLSGSELLTLLGETGLRAPASHCLRLDMSEEQLAHELVFARQIGCEYVVIPWIGLERCTSTPLATLAQQLEATGRRAREAGLQLLYHNHAYSFERLQNAHLLLDALLAACDPALLGLELDVYWAAYAGIDPLAYVRQHHGRIPLLHLKDMDAEREMSEVGDGTLDIAGIITAAEESGVRWLIVEHDHPSMPSLESARRSLHNLTALV
jgi:sugar phosphate isomerase/epimerase